MTPAASPPLPPTPPAGADPAPGPDPLALILARLDAIEARLEGLRGMTGAAAAAVDVVDEEIGRLDARGIDLDARLRALLALVEAGTEPATLRLASEGVALATTLPGLAAMAADILDEEATRLADEGLDPGEALARGARAALAFGEMVGPRELESLRSLLGSDALDREAIAVVSSAARSLVACRAEPCPTVGPLGLLRGLRDPDVRRGLGFLLQVGRHFGASLAAPSPPPAGGSQALAPRAPAAPRPAPAPAHPGA